MRFPLGAMTVGDILDRGMKILTARFPAIMAINLIVQTPALLLQLPLGPVLFETPRTPADMLAQLLALFGIAILSLILNAVATGAVVYVVCQEFLDEPAGLGDAFRVAFARLGGLVGASVLAGVIIGLGVFLCCVGMFLFWTWFALVAPVVIMEGRGGAFALGRSKELVEGFFWRVLGVLLLLGLIQGVVVGAASLLQVVFPFTERVPGPGQGLFAPQRFVNFQNYAIYAVVAFLFGAVAYSYRSVCYTLLYFDLRIRKEGFDLEMAARRLGGGEGTPPLPEVQPAEDEPDQWR